MKIGIILYPYDETKPAGLGRIICEFARAMIMAMPQDEFLIFVKGSPHATPDFPGNNWRVTALGSGFFWLDRLRSAPEVDIYIFNTPALPLFFKPRASIAIVLDFAYCHIAPSSLKEKLFSQILFWYHGYSLKKVDAVVAISEATRCDAIRLFGIPENKIKTIYFGFKNICALPPASINPIRSQTTMSSAVPTESGQTSNGINVPEKFFLFTGVFKERKNVLNIVKAYAIFHKHYPEHALVLSGKAEGSYAEKIKEYIWTEGLSACVIMPGFVSDGELSFLYQHAEALVFPSKIEGFGFPVLEAFACGLPVITSNGSSLAELGKDNAALLVDPESPEEIASAMEKVISDSSLRQALIERGYSRAKEFSWGNTVHHFQELLESLYR